MTWIETQPTFVIGIFVFGFCYLLATAILCLALMLSRRAVAQRLQPIAPVTLTPLGVILGLLSGSLLRVSGRILIAPTNTLARRPVR